MRIIAGRFKGRQLKAPKGRNTRPTTDRDREALFSAIAHQLGHDFSGLNVLDLFAGSGLLGLEALSRGAQHVTFVENNRRAAQTIQENVELLNVQVATKILVQNVLSLQIEKNIYDLVLCDAPYGSLLGLRAILAAHQKDYISRQSLCAMECTPEEKKQLEDVDYDIVWHRSRGETTLNLFFITKEK